MRIEIVSSEEILSAMDSAASSLIAQGNKTYMTGAGFLALLQKINPSVATAYGSQIWLGTSPTGLGGQVAPQELGIFIQRYVNERIEHGDFRDFQGYYAQKLLPTLVGMFQASADLQKPLVFTKLQSNTLTAELIEPFEVQFSTSNPFPSLPTNVSVKQSITQPSFTWENTLTFTNSSTTASAELHSAYFQKYITFDTSLAAGTIYSDYAGNYSQPLFQDQTAFVVNGLFDGSGVLEGMYFQNTTSQALSIQRPVYDYTYLANGKVFRNFDPNMSMYVGKNSKGYIGIKVPLDTSIAASSTATQDLHLHVDGMFIATDEVFASITGQV